MASSAEFVSPDIAISKLKGQIGRVARPNLWTAQLYTASTIGEAPETFNFRCEKTLIPGRTVATVDDTGSGPALKLPYEVNYADIDITIICSTDMIERKFFENWIDSIITSSAISGKAGLLKYHNEYARGNKMNLSQIDESGDELITYSLIDVYPIQISPMNLSWEETNTYQRFDVTLSYRYYEIR